MMSEETKIAAFHFGRDKSVAASKMGSQNQVVAHCTAFLASRCFSSSRIAEPTPVSLPQRRDFSRGCFEPTDVLPSLAGAMHVQSPYVSPNNPASRVFAGRIS